MRQNLALRSTGKRKCLEQDVLPMAMKLMECLDFNLCNWQCILELERICVEALESANQESGSCLGASLCFEAWVAEEAEEVEEEQDKQEEEGSNRRSLLLLRSERRLQAACDPKCLGASR